MKRKPQSKASSIVGPLRQAKLNASPKQTGGGGGVYEEKVIAYFLARMLSKQEALNYPAGLVTRVDTQRASELYPLDDMLLEVSGSGKMHKIACSIKSNQQFTKQGFPADFVQKAWEQLLMPADTIFDPSTDFISFITAPLDPLYAQHLSELLLQARQQDPVTLAQEIKLSGRSNAQVRVLYDSFKCPPDLATRFAAETTETGYGLSRLLWLSFDFEQQQSKDEQVALEVSRKALVPHKADKARELWGALRGIASTLRPHAGSRTLNQLVNELRYVFELTDFPDYRADWKQLRVAAESAARHVSMQIGGSITLARSEMLDEVRVAMETSRIVVLQGPSGVGKSALARLEQLTRGNEEPLLWLNAEALRGKSLSSLRNEWGLDNNLNELLINSTSARGLCVIDRLDKVYEETDVNVFGVIAELVELFRLNEPSTPWRMLLPCVAEEWSRVQQALQRQGLSSSVFKSIWVGSPTYSEQQQIWETFPQLASLGTRAHLREVMLRPKILDTLAYALSANDHLDRVLGESAVARLWLEKLVQQPHGVQRRACAEEIATLQADTLQNTLPYTLLPNVHLTAVDELVEERICVKSKQPIGVSFDHDLYGDWLRLQRLRHEADTGKLLIFIQAEHRISSPSWHRAIRLYGAVLLDEHASPTPWWQLFEQFGGIEAGTAIQDNLLESTWYAAQPLKNFLALWDLLGANEGQLLARLLGRFQYTATRPNERVIEFVRSEMPESAVYAPTWHRLPLIPEWIPMIELLYIKRTELPRAVWVASSAIVDRWLQIVPRGGYTDWAASVAIAIGDAFLKIRNTNRHLRKDKIAEEVYKAVINAARLKPEAAARILREGAGLGIEIPESITELNHTQTISGYQPHYSPPRPKWAEGGPACRVDEALQKVAVENDLGLVELIKYQPQLALELATALLIEEPKSRDADSFSITYGLEHFSNWPAAFYQNGPFLPFLEYSESKGVELILKLERRALAGWREERLGERRTNWTSSPDNSDSENTEEDPHKLKDPGMWLDLATGPRWIVGDRNVFGWHRGCFPSSDVMTSALMALEKYLYDLLDKEVDITELLNQILYQASSTAVLGTLLMVGKRNTELLTGVLLPLMGSPEMIFWDMLVAGESDGYAGVLGWTISSKQLAVLQEWRKLPHRDYPFQNYVITYFFHYEEGKQFFASARLRWQERLEDSQIPDYYEQCVDYYDISNHKLISVGGRTFFEYQESEARRIERVQHDKSQRINRVLLSWITKQKLLEDTVPLDQEQLKQLWEEVLYLESLDEETRRSAWRMDRFADVLMGSAAIFFLRGREWLMQQYQIEKWTIDSLIEGAQLLWEERNIEKDEFERVVSWKWQCFMAQALPVLWAEEMNNPVICQAIGQVALSASIEAVKYLMSQVAAQRNNSLADDSTRLAHLLILRAHWDRKLSSAIYKARSIGTGQSEVDTRNAITVLQEQRDEWLVEFVTGVLSPTIPNLDFFSNPPELRHSQTELSRPNPERPSFHPNLLIAAFLGVPTPVEQISFFPFWHAVLVNTIQRLQASDEDAIGELGGTPNDWDTWLYDQIASWLPELTRADAKQLWEPILNLGGWAHSWVLRFLYAWIRVAFNHASTSSVTMVWTDMINYCLVCPTWSVSGRSRNSEELWRSLLSLDWQTLWQPEHTSILKSLCAPLSDWLQTRWKDSHALSALAAILSRMEDTSILTTGLQWLMKPAAQLEATDEYWKHLEGNLALLLAHIWYRHEAMLRQDEQAFSAFRKLLIILITRQHKLGLELGRVVGQA